MKYTTLIRLIFCIVLALGVIIFCYGYFIYANGDENKYTTLGGVMVFPLIFLFIGLMFDENEKSDIKLMIRCALGTVAAILILYVFFVYYYEPYMLVYAIFGIGFLIAYGGLYCLVTGISGK